MRYIFITFFLSVRKPQSFFLGREERTEADRGNSQRRTHGNFLPCDSLQSKFNFRVASPFPPNMILPL